MAACIGCRHTRHVRLWQVKLGLPGDASLDEVKKRLVCQLCGNRDDNRVLVLTEPQEPSRDSRSGEGQSFFASAFAIL